MRHDACWPRTPQASVIRAPSARAAAFENGCARGRSTRQSGAVSVWASVKRRRSSSSHSSVAKKLSPWRCRRRLQPSPFEGRTVTEHRAALVAGRPHSYFDFHAEGQFTSRRCRQGVIKPCSAPASDDSAELVQRAAVMRPRPASPIRRHARRVIGKIALTFNKKQTAGQLKLVQRPTPQGAPQAVRLALNEHASGLHVCLSEGQV